MRTLTFLGALVFGLSSSAQVTCDPVTFDEFGSGYTVSNEYQPCGMIFGSVGTSLLPSIYDYGEGSWGRVLHSHDWYAAMRIDFVDPVDGTPLPVSSVTFDNPIDSEVDIIVLEAYDLNDQLIGSYTSNSPENVVFDAGEDVIAYIILDDVNDGSAYVIDNISYVRQGVNVEEASAQTLPRFYPNPFEDQLTIDRLSPYDQVDIFDVSGKLVYSAISNNTEIKVNAGDLARGRYLLKITRNGIPVLVEAISH